MNHEIDYRASEWWEQAAAGLAEETGQRIHEVRNIRRDVVDVVTRTGYGIPAVYRIARRHVDRCRYRQKEFRSEIHGLTVLRFMRHQDDQRQRDARD